MLNKQINPFWQLMHHLLEIV